MPLKSNYIAANGTQTLCMTVLLRQLQCVTANAGRQIVRFEFHSGRSSKHGRNEKVRHTKMQKFQSIPAPIIEKQGVSVK